VIRRDFFFGFVKISFLSFWFLFFFLFFFLPNFSQQDYSTRVIFAGRQADLRRLIGLFNQIEDIMA